MAKPKAILDIEKVYKIKLLEVENVLNSYPSYSLNEQNEVSGLNLSAQKIKELQPLTQFTWLKELVLAENQIVDISPISELKFIYLLNLSNNKISDISPIKTLTKITYLELENNLLIEISPIGELKQISALFISGNNIEDISPLKNLIKLYCLFLDQNKIRDIKTLKGLPKLEKLSLAGNLISDITCLSGLENLAELNLRDNQIHSISPILHLIKAAVPIAESIENDGISIGGNPINDPSMEIIGQGNDAIIRFFEKIEKEGSETILEAKVTLVGEGSAGKTSLIKRLMDPKAKLPEEKSRTRGIIIEDWEFKVQGNKKYVAHIWDFGGQDVYYPVHRFFLTENSVFVLLASSRQNTHHFDYWIPTIFQFGGRSPIILGQTCHDGNSTPWNDIGAYIANENFNIIKDQEKNYHEINLPNKNKGLAQIKRSIIHQILNLPHYKKNVPKSWVPVRELISTLQKNNCISYLSLKEKMQEVNAESFASREDVEDCVKFFHSIGIILWYHQVDKLRNWVILNPKWAVDSVYKIIDDEKVLSQKGIIFADDFERVWKDKKYDDKHAILKDMLEIFKIAFPKKSNKSDYLMPTRLQSMPAELIWNMGEKCLCLEFRYEFMPKGMVNQISAELSKYIVSDDTVWNNGVNFCNGKTISQVFEDFYNRKIIVKAKGNDARGIMTIIMNAIRDISDGYRGVKPKIIIPCTCAKCSTKKEPTTFAYDMLLEKMQEKKDAKVFCNIGEEMFLVEHLLFDMGLANPAVDKPEEKLQKRKTVKIFLASSAELKQDRKDFREFISVENDRLHKQGIYLEIVQWEYFLDEISGTRLQDEYMKKLKECDIALCLFFTKVGKYTEEEFDVAYNTFKANGTPKIWTYFKNATVNTADISAEILTLLDFKKKLKDLGHFFTKYESTPDLHLQFKRQLEKHLGM